MSFLQLCLLCGINRIILLFSMSKRHHHTSKPLHVQGMIFQSTLHFTAFFMYRVWTLKLTCNSDGAEMTVQKQKARTLELPAQRTIKASHFTPEHCGGIRGASHCLNPPFPFPLLHVSLRFPFPLLVWTVRTYPRVTPPLHSPGSSQPAKHN